MSENQGFLTFPGGIEMEHWAKTSPPVEMLLSRKQM